MNFLRNPFRSKQDEEETLINSLDIGSYGHNLDLNDPEITQIILNNTNKTDIDKGELFCVKNVRRSLRIANGNHPYRSRHSR
jgi:hypothetical protein